MLLTNALHSMSWPVLRVRRIVWPRLCACECGLRAQEKRVEPSDSSRPCLGSCMSWPRSLATLRKRDRVDASMSLGLRVTVLLPDGRETSWRRDPSLGLGAGSGSVSETCSRSTSPNDAAVAAVDARHKEYDVVPVVKLDHPDRAFDGSESVVRAPQLGDTGAIVRDYAFMMPMVQSRSRCVTTMGRPCG